MAARQTPLCALARSAALAFRRRRGRWRSARALLRHSVGRARRNRLKIDVVPELVQLADKPFDRFGLVLLIPVAFAFLHILDCVFEDVEGNDQQMMCECHQSLLVTRPAANSPELNGQIAALLAG